MSFQPKVRGLLVFADGRTKEVEPLGISMVETCEHCGNELYFTSISQMAEGPLTALPGETESENRLRVLEKYRPRELAKLDGGCVVYVQRKGHNK